MRFLACLWLIWMPLALSAQDGSDRGFIQGLLEDALSDNDADRRVRIEGFRGALSSRATIDRILIEE